MHSYGLSITCKGSHREFVIWYFWRVTTRRSRFFLKKKKSHRCYCHQIWTTKIKSVREWPGNWESTHKCLQQWYTAYATNHRAYKIPYQQSSSEYVRRLVMNFNVKRLCYVNNRPHLCIHYLSLLLLSTCRWSTTWNIKHESYCSSKKPLTRGYFIHLRYS